MTQVTKKIEFYEIFTLRIARFIYFCGEKPMDNMTSKLTIKAFNHVAIQISDIEKSRAFYSETLGLEEIPAPAFDYPVVWFSLGNGREVHLIGRKPEATFTPVRSNHFALEVSDIYLAEKMLKENGANCLPIKSRPDGILQLFLTDPDGNFIELCQI